MDTLESAAGRIVASVFELLGKPLYLVDGQSAEAAGAFAIRMSVPRLAVVCADGTPFLDRERRRVEL